MASTTLAHKLADELGLVALSKSGKDVYLLLLTRFIRMFAYGSSTLILALYFTALGHSDAKIGLFMSLTLVGDVAISLALTLIADSLGRRRILILGALLMTLSGVVFATLSNYWILLLAAIVGVISPSGNEIGPFRAVEESTIAHLSKPETRSDLFAWYVIFGTLGTAGGSLACGWITQAVQQRGATEIESYRLIFWVYAAIGLIKGTVSGMLGRACESQPESKEPDESPETQAQVGRAANDEQQPLLPGPVQHSEAATPKPVEKKPAIAMLSTQSRKILLKLCALFFLDSLASGMVPGSLIAFFMERKFAMPRGELGSVISVAALVSSVGNIFASSIAKRIGLVKTMVFTHLPSAILLALFPLPDSLVLTVILLVVRASLQSMDQAPRSAFLSAIVLPAERTVTMGIVNTVKTMSQSSGPLITGVLAGNGHFWIAFVVAGGLKASYDGSMLAMFLGTKLEGDKQHKQQNGTDEGVEPASTSADPVVARAHTSSNDMG